MLLRDYHNEKIDEAVSNSNLKKFNLYVANCARYFPPSQCRELILGLPVTEPKEGISIEELLGIESTSPQEEVSVDELLG